MSIKSSLEFVLYCYFNMPTINKMYLTCILESPSIVSLLPNPLQGRIQDFKLGGVYLKKMHRAEGGAKIFGVFRVKNHDFMPKNLIFSNFKGCTPWIRPCTCPKKVKLDSDK